MNHLTAFDVFNDLPTDIRCLIWRHAMPGPRIHRISRHEAHVPAIGSCPPPLNLLLAGHESHDEVLHNLRRLRLPSHDGPCPSTRTPSKPASSVAMPTPHKPCCPFILFNPVLDTLYLPGSLVPFNYRHWLSRPVDFSIIRHLAVDLSCSYQRPTGYDEKISIPTIVSLLGGVQDLYIMSERSYFCPTGDQFLHDTLSSWGKIIPIKDARLNGKEKDLTHPHKAHKAHLGPRYGSYWGWVEPVDMGFWEGLTNASLWEAFLTMELNEERERLLKEGYDGATKWTLPRVEMRFLRSEEREIVVNDGLPSVALPIGDSASIDLGPPQPYKADALPVDEGPTNQEIVEQRWARSHHSPCNRGLRFSTSLLERLGFRNGSKGKFKMPAS